MRGEQFAALRDAADAGGVTFEGLRVAATDDGYRFETPAGAREGLDESELRAAAEGSPYVTNWYFWEETVGHRSDHRRRFLRLLERAESLGVPERYDALTAGVETEWGQLLVTAALDGDGERAYEVRHVADAAAGRDELARREGPHAARDLARFDADGRYRPLKTAPSLDDGWVFVGLDQRAVVETVDTFYPATVANWSRERVDDLDVSHWCETAERQTGIYDVVDELDREAVERIAEACCVDSQCLKRREWEYDEGEPLAADGGDGRFPCREPCSLVVAAARKWTMLEREETRTYEFELTPSEKEQLEDIVDAVADDRTDEIREADVSEGANRYRARYLRAKRFDDEGALRGVDADAERAERE